MPFMFKMKIFLRNNHQKKKPQNKIGLVISGNKGHGNCVCLDADLREAFTSTTRQTCSGSSAVSLVRGCTRRGSSRWCPGRRSFCSCPSRRRGHRLLRRHPHCPSPENSVVLCAKTAAAFNLISTYFVLNLEDAFPTQQSHRQVV